MEENINQVIEFFKKQPIKGCITGSSLLGYFDVHQDVDCFAYDEKSFIELYYAMHHNPMFQIIDPLEQWKAKKFRTSNFTKYKTGITTIKFLYNTCINVNIILKKDTPNIFSVLSTFDLDIVARGIDIESGRMLDLSEPGNIENKIATWNRWNTHFYDPELWEINRILRQLERVFKYHRRGYNTDAVVLKYIELIDSIQELQDIFHSDTYTERLKINKNNTQAIKKICEVWLETHEISDNELEILQTKLKEI